MPACKNHPERSAAAVCSGCGVTLCTACAEADNVMRFYRSQKSSQLFCKACGFQDLQPELAAKPTEQAVREQAQQQRRRVSTAQRRLKLAVMVVLIGVLGLVQVWSIFYARPTRGVYARGVGVVYERELMALLQQLWTAGAALEAHHAAHERYPTGMSELVEAGLLDTLPEAPAGDALLYSVEDGGEGYLLISRRPRRYGMRTVYRSHDSRVPVAIPVGGVEAPE